MEEISTMMERGDIQGAGETLYGLEKQCFKFPSKKIAEGIRASLARQQNSFEAPSIDSTYLVNNSFFSIFN